MAGRRQIQKQETRDIILDCARALFEEHGYEKTTIRKVALKAGVAAGTVGAHFPDKPSLLVAALLDDLARTLEKALAAMPAQENALNKFLHLSRFFYIYYAERPNLSKTLLKEMWFLPGPWGETLQADAMAFVDLVAGLIREDQDKGLIRMEVNPELAAMSFFSFYFSCLLYGLSQTAFNPEESLATLRELLELHHAGLEA